MTDGRWYVIRTEQAKEFFVARQIERMGYSAWVPVELRHYRTSGNRRTRHRTVVEMPLVPKCLLSAIPEAVHGDLQRVRYFASLARDSASAPLQIPAVQVQRFRDHVDEINARDLARINSGRQAPKKARWVKMDGESLAEALERMFGDGHPVISSKGRIGS